MQLGSQVGAVVTRVCHKHPAVPWSFPQSCAIKKEKREKREYQRNIYLKKHFKQD